MKMSMKGKTLLKNGFLFKEQLFTNNDFAASLKLLMDKWNPSFKNEKLPVFCWSYKDYKEVRKRNKIAYNRRVNFINSLPEGRISEFQKDIFVFLDKFNFGKEWLNAIADFILSMWLYPPMFNLNTDDRAPEEKRLLLELNPDTSLDDIKEAWREINKQQKTLDPAFKKRYFTDKSFENLDVALMDKKERTRGVNETFNAEGERQMYEINDMDIAGAIWADAKDDSLVADRRRAANLRQIRHRSKKKAA
jgi:hypothetical protein